MNKHFKKISEEVLGKNPFWEYKHDVFEISENKIGDYFYGENKGGSMVVPVLDDGRLLLVLQNRYLREKVSLEFPCGGLDNSESAQECAARELLEETGYQSTNFIKSGTFDSLVGHFKNTTHVFVADELSKQAEQRLDDAEIVELVVRRVDEFEDMIRRGEVWDGATLAAWALSREHVIKKVYERQG